MRTRKSKLELIEQSLEEAEAGLLDARTDKNRTAQANIISRLYTIRMDYADELSTAIPEEDLTDDEALAAVVAHIPTLDEVGVTAVEEALAERRARGRT